MTSIPASRSARAMIFAPRSCPSRPGLATTTRIFFVLEGAAMGGWAPILWLAPNAELHRHVRLVDGADDGVGAGRAHGLRVGARALVGGAELHRALRDGDVVHVPAGPAPRHPGALRDRRGGRGALAADVVCAGLGRGRGGWPRGEGGGAGG